MQLPQKIEHLARILDQTRKAKKEIVKLTDNYPELDLKLAYQVQDRGIKIRIEEQGEKIIGYKMGLTSKAKMKQMGVANPIYGVLTSSMQWQHASQVEMDHLIHPKIEPEIAFLVSKELSGRPTADQALQACSAVCAAMEIIDSRYLNFNFTLPDVVADNCSSCGFVLGPWIKNPIQIDLSNLGMLLEIDEKASQFGSSAAIYEHPAQSLAELVTMLDQQGKKIEAGSIVLAGAATAAIPLQRNQTFKTTVQELGSVWIGAI